MFRTSHASQVLFDVLSAGVGRGELAGEDRLANTAVLLLQDNVGLRKDACLCAYGQFCSLFEQS
jgi:hypothetical protein